MQEIFERLRHNSIVQRIVTGSILGLAFWLLFWILPVWLVMSLFLLILAIILIFEWPLLFHPRYLPFWLIMPFYPILPFVMLIILYQVSQFRFLLLLSWSLVATFDVGSFIVGVFCGRHKIAPTISPKKTWEGFFGGLLATIGVLFVYQWFFELTLQWQYVVIFSAIIAVLSLCGDLFESFLKRRAGIKDTGNFLPGHGGFLDRFDSLLFVVVFIYFFKETLLAWLAIS